jgi:hypothetical protein
LGPHRFLPREFPFIGTFFGMFILTQLNFPEGALFNRANPIETRLDRDKKGLDKHLLCMQAVTKCFFQKGILGGKRPEPIGAKIDKRY